MNAILTSADISSEISVTERYIRGLSKKAVDSGLSHIKCKGLTFALNVISNEHGKAYRYTQVQQAPKRPKKKVKLNSVIDPAALPTVANLAKPTTDEKLALVSFYNASGHPLSAIVKALIMQHASDSKPQALQTRIKRWTKAFEKGGRSALEDKRGGKEFKADLELVKMACLGCANMHNTTAWGFYCFLYSKRYGLPLDVREPKSDVSESAFNRAVGYLLETDQLVKEYTQIGMDAFIYAEPSLGREWLYPNQQWEIDATPLDLMVKVPHTDGVRDYMNKVPSENYHLVRPQVIRIVDNFTGATVLGLYQSSNSYANVRLLFKAIATLGKPEQIKGDNGADYVSEHMQAVIRDMGITYVATGKGRGDEKGKIERSFRSLQHSKEFEALPGFIGHGVAQRQHLEAQATTKIEKLSGVQTNIQSDFMWWWEAENWLDNFVAMKEADKRTEHDPMPQAELSQLYKLLGKRALRKVSKQGVTHKKTKFFNFEMWQHVAIGDSVEVIENIDNSNELFMFRHGQFVCVIEDRSLTRDGVTVEEINNNKKQYKQRVVNPVKKLAKQAQKEFNEYQRTMRDEHISIELEQAQTVAELEKEKQVSGEDANVAYLDWMKSAANI
ncbi:hypothetical protein TW81_09920 [Vibrio galatheae]|uniref:Integrase catalytic domain-containing protein n=1 Tax=Vibrio galatheae TaxID=579748 RepID=A0A0F4NJM8_9VIBR|nr:DDE-type integrase/transposase/recombinase [Vibrio galatheae]KJY83302.1 hypothetical protein TW81_09920 [Vibrio galatheae]